MTRVHAGLRRLANAARMGLLPGASVEEGILRTDRFPAGPPAATDELILDLYRRLPEVRITDILVVGTKIARIRRSGDPARGDPDKPGVFGSD